MLLKPALQKRLGSRKALSRKSPRLFPGAEGIFGVKVRAKWQSSSAVGNMAGMIVIGNFLIGNDR